MYIGLGTQGKMYYTVGIQLDLVHTAKNTIQKPKTLGNYTTASVMFIPHLI